MRTVSSPTLPRQASFGKGFTHKPKDIYINDNFGLPNSMYTVLLGNDTIKCYDCADQQYYDREYSQSYCSSYTVILISF